MRVASITVFGTRAEMSELRDQLEQQGIQTVDYVCVAVPPPYDFTQHIALEIRPFEGNNDGALHPELLELLIGC